MFANTPNPPYYAVIFTSLRDNEDKGYGKMADKMMALAKEQPGFLGVDSARSEIGITVSYWKDLESIKKWQHHPDHSIAKLLGKEKWYQYFKTRIALVEKEY